MKKTTGLLAMLLALVLLGSCAAAGDAGKTFVTSFYPMYVFALNVTQGVPGAQVVNLAGQNVGCLHDYQLQTRDMVTLEKADALIINGGGMEQFMDKVIARQPQLPVIDAGSGIDMLCSEDEHDHEGHDHDRAHEVMNAHVWMDPKLAAVQVKNIADGLAAADPDNAQRYLDNAAAYIARIEALDSEIAGMLAPFAGQQIITFHESFAYFARAYGLEVAAVIAGDGGEEPSTREIAKTCDLVKEKGIGVLFVEPQYPAKSAQTIARETGAQVLTINPVVSGDGSPESYETLMRENASIMMGAFLNDGED